MEQIKKFLLIFLFLLISSFLYADAKSGIVFSITEWDTGLLPKGYIAEKDVEVSNNTEDTVEIDLISTCSCMYLSSGHFSLRAGESKVFTVFFDSSDDDGEFEKILIIRTDSPLMPKGFFLVTGNVESSKAESVNEDARPEDGPPHPFFDIGYFYTPGCKSCNEFIRKAGSTVKLYDITESENFELLQDLLSSRGIVLKKIPVLIVSEAVYQGEDEITSAYQSMIIDPGNTPAEHDNKDVGGKEDALSKVEGDTFSSGRITLSFLPVVAAGLLDGVNPCAFTTLIFLLSALSVAGRSRRETLVIGLFFTVSVFATYYLIGLGFFKIIRMASSFEIVSKIIRWLLISVLLVFAGLSFYDFAVIKAGRPREILLQLPDGIKRRMHSSIRSYSRSAALAGSSIIMGVLISIFELGCTGQIYFPTITYIIQTENEYSGYLFLALYNTAFILPLVAVFVVVYFGITSKLITMIFQKNLGIIKILTGLLFLGFAVMMLVL